MFIWNEFIACPIDLPHICILTKFIKIDIGGMNIFLLAIMKHSTSRNIKSVNALGLQGVERFTTNYGCDP